jgi:predicted acetyltransferase
MSRGRSSLRLGGSSGMSSFRSKSGEAINELCLTWAATDDDLVQLTEPPRLRAPTTAVRESWLAAERADCEEEGSSTELLERAQADFGALVAVRQGTPFWWGVPTTILWYVSGEHYLGELVIRHELTPELARSGGHIGYSIAPQWRRQGHGTRMLAAGLAECRGIGLRRVLLTCRFDNEPSRRIILANGGVRDGEADGKDRFWISLDEHRSLRE